MNEDRLAEQIGKAQRASALLNDEAFTGRHRRHQGATHRALGNSPKIRTSVSASGSPSIWSSRSSRHCVTTVANGSLSRRELEDLASGRTRKHFGVV